MEVRLFHAPVCHVYMRLILISQDHRSHLSTRAEAEQVDAEIDNARAEQKRLLAAITEKNGTPEGVSADTLHALLTLSDK